MLKTMDYRSPGYLRDKSSGTGNHAGTLLCRKTNMTFYFVRHGEIESNVKKVYAGWSNEPLTVKGVEQVRQAADQLRKHGTVINALYCSPLKRTVQTAEIIGRSMGLSPVPEKSFIEFKLGPWEGLSEEQIANRYPSEWRLWNTRPAELLLPGRETLDELFDRVLKGLVKIDRDLKGRAALIVTHVAVIRVLLLHSQKKDLNLYKTIDVRNGEIFAIPASCLIGLGEESRKL